MAKLILFNKPYQVLSSFTDKQGRKTLAEYVSINKVYPAGRLDWDSEGLLLLTDDGSLQARISSPKFHLCKTYLVQVEGIPEDGCLQQLCRGVTLNDGITRPAQAERIAPPPLWERHPPIRSRTSIADSWIKLTLREGRNRQVRRMTAAVGHPTLRLVRWRIGDWEIGDLQPGQWRQLSVHSPRQSPTRSNDRGQRRH